MIIDLILAWLIGFLSAVLIMLVGYRVAEERRVAEKQAFKDYWL